MGSGLVLPHFCKTANKYSAKHHHGAGQPSRSFMGSAGPESTARIPRHSDLDALRRIAKLISEIDRG